MTDLDPETIYPKVGLPLKKNSVNNIKWAISLLGYSTINGHRD